MTSTLPVPSLAPPPPDEAAPPAHRNRPPWSAFFLGRTGDEPWVRPSLLGLLALTGVLYLWGLGRSGWANAFYSAAVQAGSVSWKAFFFGSSDAANSITVDKTPGSLWIMELSVRMFGLNSWSILVPEALMGIATVALVYATVRRWYGPAAGLIAGAVCALTPVAVLMFRFNNPDALLTLLMVVGAYAVVRAIEKGSTWWLVLAGASVGFGFLTKMLQALLVVPAYALAYLVAGPPRLGKRIGQLLLAGLAMVASAGWYIAIVELMPASARPYIGGSQNNSLLELTLGYNGFGRLSGDETGSVGGGGGWGATGLTRLFQVEQAGQVSWLLPAALILLVAGLVVTLRAPRTERLRAGLLLWGGWLVGTALVFSLMQGIFHAYYTVALAPAIGAVAGMGSVLLWRARRWGRWFTPFAAAALALAVAGTAWWSYHLLSLSPNFVPWLKWLVLVGGLVAAAGLLFSFRLFSFRVFSFRLLSFRLPRRVAAVAVGLALGASLAGPFAYAVQTASQPHTGSIPSAGPAVTAGFGGGGFRGQGGFPRFNGGGAPGGFPGGAPGGFPGGATGGFPGGLPGGLGGARGGGGLLDAATVSSDMTALLENDAGAYTWVAAAIGSQNASGYQLATGKPVMAIGGFNGSDPSPTLAQFQQYVAAGKIHYFIGGGGFGGFGGRGGNNTGGSSESAQIAQWVQQNFTATTVGNTTVYDLSGGVQ